MRHHDFTFHGARLRALASGALHWPEQGLLCVSDLHLGKAERQARRGGSVLPPYEVTDTLTRLQDVIEATRPETVLCLGDSFDDAAAAQALSQDHRLWLTRLQAGRRWIWIEGNHDPGPLDLGGSHLSSLGLGPLTFRHIAEPEALAEVSGHYHPKAPLRGRARPAFLLDGARLILPAFGTYTGGLRSRDPALRRLMQPGALALLTGPALHVIPMPR
ncbi:ligase-associated DNA damage response endonuclease PdeM [Pseudooceanicola sp. CBS1P-1]|uniref:Ligase-associated DNA damage response endonuclease PdeM n=1 Tax=Pseudooceanicola albus TaxID=2692189 RepID=A0A6L7FYQ9_9RHOB|nr:MULTISPECIES: ligase-associated DNA damage response endonuclease PdeM [Pseudooceanicola]MBT9382696.1 ligase-associated DNA damage response endonuclease PdeM [Pseudooceanicola endophyticus]MXN17234.1 ligase-associated DNA damage response endonuclease PdeM [Pseudooceanicola albus]